MVPADKVAAVTEAWEREYYSKRELTAEQREGAVVVSRPGSGSAAYLLKDGGLEKTTRKHFAGPDRPQATALALQDMTWSPSRNLESSPTVTSGHNWGSQQTEKRKAIDDDAVRSGWYVPRAH
ncbi:hypothetical protein CH063_15156 [Colletotrichum higginsianum]|uniref:Uncharacterized protein n=1 Tax=Colletotrichum higginsianum (strain IMI 349063) TaxID=759273 RepID=H1W1M5_COLHI|nr:hypothetical protein CH063_15156 [Colletotrichum higginsianum]